MFTTATNTAFQATADHPMLLTTPRLENTSSIDTLTTLPDGRVASASDNKNTIHIWDTTLKKCVTTLVGHTGYVTSLTVLPNGYLVSGSEDKTIRVWDVSEESTKCVLTLSLRQHYVTALAALSDGRLASGSEDNTIRIWEISPDGGKCVLTLSGHEHWVIALTELPDGRLASGSSDEAIRLWNLNNGTCEATLIGHTDYVTALTVLPNGYLASGSEDKTIRVWEVSDNGGGRCVAILPGQNYITVLKALPNGYLTSGSEDKIVRIWEVSGKSGRCIATLPGHHGIVKALTMLPDGRLVSGSTDMSMLIWNISDILKNTAKKKLAPQVVEGGTISRSSQERVSLKSTSSSERNVALIPADTISLGRRVGKGAFGTVYEGTWQSQTVAVKCYEGANLSKETTQEIQHEVDIMLGLRHKCLVQLFGLVQEEHRPVMLVMEYGENGSLNQYLHSHQGISWGLRLRLANELAEGLAYLHEKRIVHRDIKSSNVILDRDYHAKWCDFGLAVLKSHLISATMTIEAQAENKLAGTLNWMAPELFSRKTSIPRTASDIWALGMVFFELASRKIPFQEAQDQQQVIYWILNNKGEEIPEECLIQSPGFAAVMRDCWKERYFRPTAEHVATVTGTLLAAYAQQYSCDNLNILSQQAISTDDNTQNLQRMRRAPVSFFERDFLALDLEIGSSTSSSYLSTFLEGSRWKLQRIKTTRGLSSSLVALDLAIDTGASAPLAPPAFLEDTFWKLQKVQQTSRDANLNSSSNSSSSSSSSKNLMALDLA